MSSLMLFLIVLAYIALLFAVARYGDRGLLNRLPATWVYSFTIAIYCTSWTFYGAVGTAVNDGWNFFSIYLGPILLFTLGFPILYKVLVVSKEQNISSLADFIASRFGKKPTLAIGVTLLLVAAIVPYIALQLKAIASAFDALTLNEATQATEIDTALFTAIAMAVLAILFGTQSAEATKPRSGLMYTVAFESLVKLVALVALAFFCVYFLLQDYPGQWQPLIQQQFTWSQFDFSFATQVFLSACAMLCLPRQFHVTFVENTAPGHLNHARWSLPLYLLIISVVIFPITALGTAMFGGDPSVSPDSYVLTIPIEQNYQLLSTFMFIGGFAASTGMIIISTLALSTMITNSIIMPYLLKKQTNGSFSYRSIVLAWRRGAITFILLAAYLYKVIIGENFALATTGLIAFSLVAQLVPSLLFALYSKRANSRGVIIGLIAGSSIWFYFIMLPLLARAIAFEASFIEQGPWKLQFLAPENFFGLPFDAFDVGVWLSLTLNTLAIFLFSSEKYPNFTERVQAEAFTHPLNLTLKETEASPPQSVINQDIVDLLERFLGPKEANALLNEYKDRNLGKLSMSDSPSQDFLRFCEKRLAGAIGSSTASTVIRSVIEGKSVTPESLVNLFDETSQQIKFNQKLLQATLENISQGISVVDRELNLVAWNQRYLELFNYPQGFIRAGMPIADVVRYNAEKGVIQSGTIEQQITKRLNHLRRGTPYVFQREWPNGRVLEIRGNPMPGGGFVTSFSDITEYKNVERQLKESRDQLEQRVEERTEEIQNINQELTQEIERRKLSEQAMHYAKQDAERANRAKTQFIALASHDILQPLTAARLYASALQEGQDNETLEVVQKINLSLKSTENLVATLLEIARFDQGAYKPKIQPIDLQTIIEPLINEFSVLAEERHMQIRNVATNYLVRSDRQWLRRIVQNYLSNAIKYSTGNKILIGCKRYGNKLRLIVGDTGPGISAQEQKAIFSDFYRSPNSHNEESGAGLGLGVVSRMGDALEHQVGLISEKGHGSLFYVEIPITKETPQAEQIVENIKQKKNSHVRAWYVDNDPQQLDAMLTLVSKWGIELICISTPEHAMELASSEKPDILLMDYDLNATLDGIALYKHLVKIWSVGTKAILLTATPGESIRIEAKENKMEYLKKPAKPAALRALLN